VSARLWRAILPGALLAASALAQPEAPVPDPAPRESHGWIATHVLGGEAAALLHLPPRSPTAGVRGADAGVARQIQSLAQLPGHTVWWGRRVYLLYPQSGAILDVFSVRVSPTAVPAYWAAEPITGATAEPSLPLHGARVVDATGARHGLAVLVRDSRWRLWMLAGAAWESVEMPPGLAAADDARVRFVRGSEPVTLLADYQGSTVRWTLQDLQGGRWEPTPLADAGRWPEAAVLASFESGGDVCVAVRTGSGVEVWSLGPRIEGRLAELSMGGAPVALAPIDSGVRLAVLSVVRNEDADGREQPVERWELVEVSLSTGRPLFRGQPRSGAPITGEDIRWLSLAMVGLVVAVLFYLLRPVPARSEVLLPEGCALAEPGRRIAAGMLDAALVAVGASLLLGIPIQQVLLVTPLLGSAQGVLTLAGLVGAGTLYGTAAEWLWGRTLGKMLAACEVVSVTPGRARVGLMRTAARNLFKWGLAPWALLGLAAGEGRHRGDEVAGSAVVVRIEREEADGDGEGPG